MSRVRPISLNIIPDVEWETPSTAAAVLNAYTTAMARSRNEPKAFAAAVLAWRELHPKGPPDEGPPAVAAIIRDKL
jgi:hypothetical protein